MEFNHVIINIIIVSQRVNLFNFEWDILAGLHHNDLQLYLLSINIDIFPIFDNVWLDVLWSNRACIYKGIIAHLYNMANVFKVLNNTKFWYSPALGDFIESKKEND